LGVSANHHGSQGRKNNDLFTAKAVLSVQQMLPIAFVHVHVDCCVVFQGEGRLTAAAIVQVTDTAEIALRRDGEGRPIDPRRQKALRQPTKRAMAKLTNSNIAVR
jgi:hypothetical protein